MKNEKGMSHVTLVIIIVIIAFIIITTIHYARIIIEKSSIESLETNMLQIQGKTKILSEEATMNDNNDILKGRKLESYKESEEIKKLLDNGTISTEEEKFSKYYLLDNLDLEGMKLGNIKINKGYFIVNYDTEEVIYSEGINKNGKIYYKLSELQKSDDDKKEENNTEIQNVEQTVEEETEETTEDE